MTSSKLLENKAAQHNHEYAVLLHGAFGREEGGHRSTSGMQPSESNPVHASPAAADASGCGGPNTPLSFMARRISIPRMPWLVFTAKQSQSAMDLLNVRSMPGNAETHGKLRVSTSSGVERFWIVGKQLRPPCKTFGENIWQDDGGNCLCISRSWHERESKLQTEQHSESNAAIQRETR